MGIRIKQKVFIVTEKGSGFQAPPASSKGSGLSLSCGDVIVYAVVTAESQKAKTTVFTKSGQSGDVCLLLSTIQANVELFAPIGVHKED